jgi:DNA-binding NarL/FixJ family response regulator
MMNKLTPPNSQPLVTAIVSRPGIMQQALRAALAAVPAVVVVASLGDGLTALNYVATHPPALLVIDCNLLDEEVEALLAAIKARQLYTRCLVLTRSHLHGEHLLASGADAVVTHDSSQKELAAVVTRLQTERL